MVTGEETGRGATGLRLGPRQGYSYYEPGRYEFLQVDITHNIGLDLLMRSGLIGFGLFAAALTSR